MQPPFFARFSFLTFPFAFTSASVLALAACTTKTVTAPGTATPGDGGASSTLAEEYQRLGDNLGSSVAQLKTSAKTAGSVTPATFGSVAAIPKAQTGGVDIAEAQNGKSGERSIDIDAIGEKETVAIFVPDAPTGTGTSATLPSFAAWKGDADSGDEGLCYLAWTKGASWVVASTCGDTSGAWVCQITSSTATCSACTDAGECAPCDMAESNFTCAW